MTTPAITSNKPYYQYAAGVRDGRIVCCLYVKQAVNRFYELKEKYAFDEAEVDRVIDFISNLKHFRDQHAGKPFILEQWQSFIVASIYGFKLPDGRRLVNKVYMEVARKNGKSALFAALCLYHFIANERGAQVFMAANSKEQVKDSAWPLCSNFANSLDPKGRKLDVQRDRIIYEKKKSYLRVLASDSSKMDGGDPSMYLLDEYHAAKNNLLKNVLDTGQGNRVSPMAMIATTAGFDQEGPCFIYRKMCIEVLTGLKEDDRLFSIIYTIDEGDVWANPATWTKSNPNLNVTVREDYLEGMVTLAKNSTAEEVGIKTKNFNVWCDSATTWIPSVYILKSMKKMTDDEWTGKDIYGGIDLASTGDLTSATIMRSEDGKIHFKTWYFLPQETLNVRKSTKLYNDWYRAGWLEVTPGNVTDYDYVLAKFLQYQERSNYIRIGYDQWNARPFATKGEGAGLPLEPFSQSIGNFNIPTKELERLILSDKIVIDDNGITRYCFANAVLKTDHNGNVKPIKGTSNNKKIDGLISIITAFGEGLLNPYFEY